MTRRKARLDKPRRSGTHNHGWKPGACRTCGAWCAGCEQCACAADATYGARVRADLARAQAVHEGKAFGGPRDGIKLKASARWDGKLHGNDDGHYEWQGAGWQWLPTPSSPRRDGRWR